MLVQSELLSLRATVKLGGKDGKDTTTWFDGKFYPYSPLDAMPVFAVTGGCNTVICRCVFRKENCIEILRWFKDEDSEANYNSLDWSRAANGDPLVCVSGDNPQIKVLNVKTGEIYTTLAGHGDAVEDLAVSPADETILASAANDHSIRIWTLDPAYEQQPTAAILYGEGHKDSILALDFHRNGQYLLSGGMDTRVNLWMLPKDLKDNLGSDKPHIIRYPLFSSTEIHANYVDCVRFYNDFILSRAAEQNKILLWKIENFNSDAPPPTSLPMPPFQAVKSDKPVSVPASSISGTRSAWGGRFQRLLQFAEPNSELFYIRFGLFHQAGKHPLLVAGNQKSRIFQWDLQRLEDAGLEDEKSVVKKKTKKDASLLSNLKSTRADRIREGSVMSNASSAAQSNSSGPSTGTATASTTAKRGRPVKEKEKRTTGIGDPFKSISPHESIMVPKVEFTVRQVSFSPGGEWCIACGEHGMIAVMSRWEESLPDPETGS